MAGGGGRGGGDVERERERKRKKGLYLYKEINLITRTFSPMTSSKKTLPPNTVTLRVGLQHMSFEGDITQSRSTP